MANATDARAKQVHGGNPQSLVDQILRNRIYSNIYWKEKLAGVTAEDLVERAVELKYIGGTYGGNRKPTKFLCMVLKLLQIQPEKQIVYTFIDNEHYKYVRALGLFYLRLVGSSEEVYAACDKLMTDWRPLVDRKHDGSFGLLHMDEFADQLLRNELLFDINLPRLTNRQLLEDQGKVAPYDSVMQQALDAGLDEDGQAEHSEQGRERSRSRENKKSKKGKKEKKDRKRSRSREEDSEERRQRKLDKKLKKLLKKNKKEKKQRDKEKQQMVEENSKKADDYWLKLRQEQGISGGR